MNRVILAVLFAVFMTACKKDQENPQVSGGPTNQTNGWSYLGSTGIKVVSANSEYQIYLAKVHQHSPDITDVFYGVRYKMINYFGSGNGIYINSTRWLVGQGGNTIRHIDNVDEFSESAGLLYKPIYKSSLGEDYVVDWIYPIDVKVMGSGPQEFKVYNPGSLLFDAYFSSKYNGYQFAAGSPSPLSMISSPVCHLGDENRLVETGEYWAAYNLAIGLKQDKKESFLFAYTLDSSWLKVSAITPHLTNHSEYGMVKKTNTLFGKHINEIIPQWNNNYKLEFIPAYFQYAARPDKLYLVLQNETQLFLVEFDLKTFKFVVKGDYSQPRSEAKFDRHLHHIQFIEDDPEAFIFTQKTNEGTRVTLYKNRQANLIQLPEFNEKAAKSIMDVRYDQGKFWILVAAHDGSVNLYSKDYE